MVHALLQDWATALKGAEIEHVRQLLDTHPTLLWQPLHFNELDYPRTMTHFKDTSHQHFKDVTITQIYGIQLLIIILFEKSLSVESDEAKLLSFLIGIATAADLNTCFWGSTRNTTLHLVSNLGQSPTTIQQLLDQGASADIPNDDGYFAKDVLFPKCEVNAPLSGENNNSSTTTNSSSNTNSGTRINRFNQLRQLAEDGGGTISSTLSPTTNITTKRQNSTRRYFQPGHLEERRRKVLQEEESDRVKLDHDEDKNTTEKRKGKTNTKRQQEVESLAKQSRVRNNPLLKKFEAQHQQQQERTPPQSSSLSATAVSRRKFLEPTLEKSNDRRISKGITSLKDRSFVSASVFRRQQQSTTNSNDTSESSATNHPSTENKLDQIDDYQENLIESDAKLINIDQHTSLPEELESTTYDNGESIPPTDNKASDLEPIHHEEKHGHTDGEYLSDTPTRSVNESNDNTVEDMKCDFSPTSAKVESSQNVIQFPTTPPTKHSKHMLPTRKSHQSFASDSESELWFDSYEEYAENEARKSAILLNISHRQSLLKQNVDQNPTVTKDDDAQLVTNDMDGDHIFDISDNSTKSTSITPSNTITDHASAQRLSHETEESHEVFKFQSPAISEDESVDTWPPPSPKSYTANYMDDTLPPVPSLPANKVVTAQADHTTTDESPPILQQTEKKSTVHHIDAIDSSLVVRRVSLCHKKDDTTLSSSLAVSTSERNEFGDTRQCIQQQQQQQQQAAISATLQEDNQPLAANKPHPILPLIPETASSGYGKIYIRMTQAHDILLPLPIETTYVRCVISDGRQEYISRYEVLSNNVQFRYECTLDTYPNMIVSVALQVRPDPHVRPLTGLFNRLLFTSVYRQKKTLLGYVHPEDYLIGQARFALEDMIPVCNQKTYSASFDCFNSWFVQSTKERRRATATAGGQIIKVVGQLAVDMLYLPVSDPSMSIPNSLQECDLALRIRQWHGTCWCRGYLSTRQKDGKIWCRQYFQLIGSRLLGFDSADDSTKFTSCYDITDAVQLIVAAEQVLVDTENFTTTGQSTQPIFSQNTICEDNRRGFFRITFSTGCHIDCVSDHVYDSEVWVRTLRAMIGRVPLTVSAAVFLE